MTDVTLIHPGAQQQIYGDLSHTHTALEPPPWTRMIAGWLRDRDYDVAIIDQEAAALSSSDVSQRLKANPPRLIVVTVAGHQPSASTQQMVGARELVRSLRALAPILMVGNHPSALPERTLIEEAVQYVCDGEGPLTIQGLLEGEPLEEIPGLVYRLPNAEIQHNKPAPLIPIDELHGDVWDLLPMHRYRAHTWQCLDGSPRQPYSSLYSTLGCPYQCHFCCINVFQHSNRYRRRSPVEVASQIRRLHDVYGVHTFKVADELFILNENHYVPIAEMLAKTQWAEDLNIWVYGRPDSIRKDHLPLLRKAGIRWIALGIESAAESVRDAARKSISESVIREACAAIQEAGISIIGNFVVGLPNDTRETVRQTLDFAKSLNLEFANFYAAQAYPGSPLFDDTPPEHLPDSWAGYSQHGFETRPLPTDTLTSAQVLELRDQAHVAFFSDPAYLEHVDHKFGGQAVVYAQSIAERLPRKLLDAA